MYYGSDNFVKVESLGLHAASAQYSVGLTKGLIKWEDIKEYERGKV